MVGQRCPTLLSVRCVVNRSQAVMSSSLWQLPGRRSCPGTNLECDRIGSETASLAQEIKYPVGIRGSCGVVSRGIKAGGLAADRLVNERFSHSEVLIGLWQRCQSYLSWLDHAAACESACTLVAAATGRVSATPSEIERWFSDPIGIESGPHRTQHR